MILRNAPTNLKVLILYVNAALTERNTLVIATTGETGWSALILLVYEIALEAASCGSIVAKTSPLSPSPLQDTRLLSARIEPNTSRGDDRDVLIWTRSHDECGR
jgi:hypothetical protein